MMDFQAAVYAAAKKIPEGKVASYSQLALIAGKPGAARAAGHAMGRCRDSSVPCHRVVHQDGSTTAAFDTLEHDTQRRLLEREGVKFKDNGRIDMARFQWKTDVTLPERLF